MRESKASKTRRKGATVRCLAASMSLAALSACAAEPAEGPPTTSSSAPLPAREATVCRADEVGRYPLVLENGDQVYIEPQAIQSIDRGFLIAGSPSYEWRLADTGVWSVGTGELLGAFVRDGAVEPVMRPKEVADVGWVRVVSVGDGHFAWLLEEVSRSGPDSRKTVERIVYAESLGAEWLSVEVVPTPDGGALSFPTSSQLVVARGDLHWIAPFHEDSGVRSALWYGRSGGSWRWEVIAADLVEDVALSSGGGEVRMGLAGRAPELGPEHFALQVRTIPDGLMERLFVPPPGERVSDVRFAPTETGGLAAWLLDSPSGKGAWASNTAEDIDFPPTLVDRRAIATMPVAVGPHLLSVVHHYDAVTGTQELRIYRTEGRRVERLISLLHPYRGYFTVVATSSSELSVIGPEIDPKATHPFVRSLVLRLSVSCT